MLDLDRPRVGRVIERVTIPYPEDVKYFASQFRNSGIDFVTARGVMSHPKEKNARSETYVVEMEFPRESLLPIFCIEFYRVRPQISDEDYDAVKMHAQVNYEALKTALNEENISVAFQGDTIPQPVSMG